MIIKLKKAKDKIVKITGYALDVERRDGYISLSTDGDYPYVVPDGYVAVTLNDDFGNEFYVIAHKDMEIEA